MADTGVMVAATVVVMAVIRPANPTMAVNVGAVNGRRITSSVANVVAAGNDMNNVVRLAAKRVVVVRPANTSTVDDSITSISVVIGAKVTASIGVVASGSV